MGFWSRLFGGDEAEAEAEERPPLAAQPAVPPASNPLDTPRAAAQGGAAGHGSGISAEQLERLEKLGRAEGADLAEALGVLRATEGTPGQTAVLQLLLRVLPHGGPGFEPLRVACASILVQRGQGDQALTLVRGSTSVQGMMLTAELHAAAGDLAHAVSTIERVLARAIDTPGARERHERWCQQLGRPAQRAAAPANDGATVVAPKGPKTPFRLLREVARGGAGTIYEAEDALLGRRLAFKVYHRAERDREQIEREARRAIELFGPGVIQVFDADPEAGWLAIEWLSRGSLRDILRTGRCVELLPLSRWFPRLLQGVARVHQRGLVHADLKPGNVLFRSPDDPVLADFGICRKKGEQSLTGTPGYLAPERLAGGPADPRDDVYAIGRILEDVLNALEVVHAAQGASLAPALSELPDYERVARACLRDARDRPPDAAAVLAQVSR